MSDSDRSIASSRSYAHGADGDELAHARARIERLEKALEAERHALQRSEARFRAVQDASSDPFFVERALRDDADHVVDFELVWANAAARSRGGSLARIGARMSHALAPAGRDAALDTLGQVLETGASARLAVVIESPGATWNLDLYAVRIGRDLVAVTAQVLDERHAAELERAALLTRERRARAEAEAALQSSQTTLALLDAVLDNSPSGVAFFDRNLRYIRVNRALAQLTGVEADAHVGRTVRETTPDLAPVIEPLLEQVLAKGVAISQALARSVAPREGASGGESVGDPREWLASLFPVYGPDGAILGVGLDTVEITELALARRRAEELAEELEHAAAEREALLARERDARRDAEVANRLKDEFLAIVSHELRTPLHAIRGWASLAKNGGGLARSASVEGGRGLDPTIEKALEVIERNSEAQARIIDDLLDASRIIAGKLSLEVQTIDLAAIARDGVEAVRPAALSKGISISCTGPQGDARVVADLGRMRQVVSNLLSNALKFTPRGGRVALALEARAGEVVLEVRDTGAGIPEELLPHVFDRFRQGERATTRRHGGLGLGLSIVRQIVELHGGCAYAASGGPDRGATFTIALPRRPPSSAPITVRPPPPPQARSRVLRSYRVVVVDDETDARELASHALRDAGAEVSGAGSAAEAMELVRTVRPHAIVSDVGMPGSDGYSFAERLRAHGVSVPMVALTAYAGAADAARARAAGFDAHLRKPVEPARLVGAVARLLGEDDAAIAGSHLPDHR